MLRLIIVPKWMLRAIVTLIINCDAMLRGTAILGAKSCNYSTSNTVHFSGHYFAVIQLLNFADIGNKPTSLYFIIILVLPVGGESKDFFLQQRLLALGHIREKWCAACALMAGIAGAFSWEKASRPACSTKPSRKTLKHQSTSPPLSWLKKRPRNKGWYLP